MRPALRAASLTLALLPFFAASPGQARAEPGADATPDVVIGGPCAEAQDHGVRIFSFGYDPAGLQIQAGDLVVWTEGVNFPHTTTEDYLFFDADGPLDSVGRLIDPPLWDSGGLPLNAQFSVQFCATGTFNYHCEVHPELMQAEVVVT